MTGGTPNLALALPWLDGVTLLLLAASLWRMAHLTRLLRTNRTDAAALVNALAAIEPSLTSVRQDIASAHAALTDTGAQLAREASLSASTQETLDDRIARAEARLADLQSLIPQADTVLDRLQATIRAARPAPNPPIPVTQPAMATADRLRSQAERDLMRALARRHDSAQPQDVR